MRLVALVVLVAALLASIGSTFLRERSDTSAPERDAAAVVAPESAPKGTDAEFAAPAVERLSSTIPTGKSAAPAKSIFYQWVDERGSVNFAASLDDVPVAWRKRAGQVEFDAGAFVQADASSRAMPSHRPQPLPDAAPNRFREVTVYTAPWCGWCRKTLAFLDERGVDYVNKDIEADEEYAAELREKTGRNAVPFVEIDGSEVRGFNPAKMTALLD